MLLDSAIEIIYKKGYAKTTLEDIVKNINMTRGAFYWHFKNKKEMLIELESRYENKYLRDYGDFKIYDTVYNTLKALMFQQIDYIFNDEYNKMAFIMRYRIESLTELPDLYEKQRYIDEFSIKRIEEQIVRGIECGEFKNNLDSKRTAVNIFSFIVGIENVKMVHKDDNVFNVDLFKRNTLDLLNGLKK